jgi:hypothetical protein
MVILGTWAAIRNRKKASSERFNLSYRFIHNSPSNRGNSIAEKVAATKKLSPARINEVARIFRGTIDPPTGVLSSERPLGSRYGAGD